MVNNYYYELAKISSNISDLDAKIIYCQWEHETNNFTNWGTRVANNFGGLKQFQDQPQWFTDDAQSPEGDNYQVFNTPEAYAVYFGKYLRMFREDGIYDDPTIEGYARALRHGWYYGNMPGMDDEESIQNYIDGITRVYREEFSDS
jgi:hypothetical protein